MHNDSNLSRSESVKRHTAGRRQAWPSATASRCQAWRRKKSTTSGRTWAQAAALCLLRKWRCASIRRRGCIGAQIEKAANDGDLEKLDSYCARFGWLAGASLRAWAEVRKESKERAPIDYGDLVRELQGQDDD